MNNSMQKMKGVNVFHLIMGAKSKGCIFRGVLINVRMVMETFSEQSSVAGGLGTSAVPVSSPFPKWSSLTILTLINTIEIPNKEKVRFFSGVYFSNYGAPGIKGAGVSA